MSWLRLILLVGGLLFIGVLIWLERRRPSRVQQDGEFRVERSEPPLGFADEPAPRTTTQGEEAPTPLAPRGPDPGRAPPLIDWSTPVTVASADPPLIIIDEISPPRTAAATAAPGAEAVSYTHLTLPTKRIV